MKQRTVIIVQEIRTVWTKASRGGPAAVRRNAVPEVARVPLPQSSWENDYPLFYHHQLLYHEDSFASPVQEVNEHANSRSLSIGCVEVGRPNSADQVWATFRYTGLCGGAPTRSSIPKTLLLEAEEWGQIVYNGRFPPPWDGPWKYEKTVVNFGLFTLPLPNGSVFTSKEPTKHFSAMAHLF